MPFRPEAVAFDMVETTFSLETLRPRLIDAGLDGQMLETWFAGMLRDAFALDTMGVFHAFPDIAKATLASMGLSSDRIDHVIDGFTTLDAHPDAAPAMEALRSESVRVLALTNGSAPLTERILQRNGLDSHVERVIGIAEIGRWKPAPAVYDHAADAMGVSSARMALFAAHPWDCAGAARAGFATGFVARGGGYPSVMPAPDAAGDSLVDLARTVLGWPSP